MDKQQTDRSGETLVSFRPPGDVAATTVSLVGEFNDWSADAYVPNEIGGEDSVVDLTDQPVVDPPTDGATDEARPSTRPSRTDGGRVPACR